MTLNERATRKRLIDHALSCAGWSPVRPYEERVRYEFGAVEEYPTANGPADYILFLNRQPVAIVEAKKLAIGPQNVLRQAQRYVTWVWSILILSSTGSTPRSSTPPTAKSSGSRIYANGKAVLAGWLRSILRQHWKKCFPGIQSAAWSGCGRIRLTTPPIYNWPLILNQLVIRFEQRLSF